MTCVAALLVGVLIGALGLFGWAVSRAASAARDYDPDDTED